jgi:hypothetical protein
MGLAPTLPLAAGPGGTLILEIGGETAGYELWVGQSDHSGNASWRSINIYARPSSDDLGFGTLTLGFEVVNGRAGNPEASLRSEAGQLYSGDEAGALAVEVTEAADDGDLLVLTGSFSGDFGTSENFGRDIDLSEPVGIEGSFAVRLPALE